MGYTSSSSSHPRGRQGSGEAPIASRDTRSLDTANTDGKKGVGGKSSPVPSWASRCCHPSGKGAPVYQCSQMGREAEEEAQLLVDTLNGLSP